MAACRAALRPLVRMLLRHGVMHRELVEMTKQLYVEVARRDYGLRGRPTNISRIALLTGLDRKEIARLKKTLDEDDRGPRDSLRREHDRIARVLSGWHQDPDYLGKGGKPRVLAVRGPAPSFEQLVKRYGGDVPSVTILRELARTKAVRKSADKIKVLRRNYRLDTVDADSLARAGSVLADIGETVTHNLYRDGEEPSRLEARASNVRLGKSAVKAYRAFIYTEGQVFLEKVDAWLTQHESDNGERDHDPRRIGVGLYWIESEEHVGGES